MKQDLPPNCSAGSRPPSCCPGQVAEMLVLSNQSDLRVAKETDIYIPSHALWVVTILPATGCVC